MVDDSSYSVVVINANYRSSHDKCINLDHFHSSLLPSFKINSKLCSKPAQLVIKDEKGTVIFFSNGKLRIMGCIDELEATFLAYKYTMMIDDDYNFQPVYSQSMTVKVVVSNKINLQAFVDVCSSSLIPFQYETELFPAVLIRTYKPISVNVFSSGKIIMCGVRDIQQVHDIIHELMPYLAKCQQL
jgi:TATA-box binding protein (TBP) (component of TFIID and TFIIIB)